MPLFDFACECGHVQRDIFQPIATTTSTIPCPACQNVARKVLSFPAVKKPFRPHFNMSVGKYVTNESEFKAALSQASDVASARTGIDHNYTPISAQEQREVMGVDDTGLDATYDANVKAGLVEAKRYV